MTQQGRRGATQRQSADRPRADRPADLHGDRRQRREDDRFERSEGRPAEDPGAYIGRLPERSTRTIPDGLTRRDRRVSGVATRPGPRSGDTTLPEGHREGSNADDSIRDAGKQR